MAYRLEGSLLEVCDCDVLCPCWIGENPDTGTWRGASPSPDRRACEPAGIKACSCP